MPKRIKFGRIYYITPYHILVEGEIESRPGGEYLVEIRYKLNSEKEWKETRTMLKTISKKRLEGRITDILTQFLSTLPKRG